MINCQQLEKTFFMPHDLDMFHISSLEVIHTYLSEQCVVLFYGAMGTLCIYYMKFIKHLT